MWPARGYNISRERGVTLIELITVMAILGAVMGVLVASLWALTKYSEYQSGTMVAQQNAQSALRYLEYEIRSAGHLIDLGGYEVMPGIRPPLTGGNSTAGSDTLYVTRAATVVGTLLVRAPGGSNIVRVGFYDSTSVNTGKRRFIAFEGIRRVYEVTAISGGQLTLNLPIPRGLGQGTRVFLVVGKRVYAAGNVLWEVNHTSVVPVPVAGMIRDVQFRYGLDLDLDNKIDAWVDNPRGQETSIRAVRVYVLGMSNQRARGYIDRKTWTIADHVVQFNDKFRKFLLTTEVWARNLGS